jgi:hypothetical protein
MDSRKRSNAAHLQRILAIHAFAILAQQNSRISRARHVRNQLLSARLALVWQRLGAHKKQPAARPHVPLQPRKQLVLKIRSKTILRELE